jgi:outer membrane protein assembly factor BamB
MSMARPATVLAVLLATVLPKAVVVEAQMRTLRGPMGFGASIATSAGRLLIGAPNANLPSAEVREYDVLTGTIVRSFPQPTIPGQEFGDSLALLDSGDLVVGAPFVYSGFGTSSLGAAYVFDGATGELLLTLQLTNEGDIDDLFGSVVLSVGDAIAVSAPKGAQLAGLVYLFASADGRLLKKIQNPDPASERFGAALGVLDGNLLVGSPEHGAVYAFDPTTGSILRTLNDPRAGEDDGFGAAIAVDGDRIAIGAPFASEGGGRAYVFAGASGTLLASLTSPEVSADGFGTSVALLGDNIFVGAPQSPSSGPGKLYMFSASTGELRGLMQSSTPAMFDAFGQTLGIAAGEFVIVGAPGMYATSPGAAFIVGPCGNGLRESTEACDGGLCCSSVCQLESAGVTCRLATGGCDRSEICDGVVADCPPDAVEVTGTVCRQAVSDCDATEVCDGTSKECPGDAFLPFGAACTGDDNICTDDRCDGEGYCLSVYNTLPCDDGDVCSADDRCDAGVCTGTRAVEAMDVEQAIVTRPLSVTECPRGMAPRAIEKLTRRAERFLEAADNSFSTGATRRDTRRARSELTKARMLLERICKRRRFPAQCCEARRSELELPLAEIGCLLQDSNSSAATDRAAGQGR